jgi:flagellar biosynthesis anti-sigma factor FlgM
MLPAVAQKVQRRCEMNISFGTTPNNTIADPTLVQSSSANRTQASQKPSHGDAAVVSLGSGVDELQTKLDAMSDVQSDRVQQLQAMVAQGTYSVNPANVANAMFATLFGES